MLKSPEFDKIINDEVNFISFNLSTQIDGKIIADLAFRFVLYLLRKRLLAEAEEIINLYLPNNDTGKELRQICENERIKSGVELLNKYNQTIESLNNHTLSLNDATVLFKNLDKTEKSISALLPDTKKLIIKDKSLILDYIILKSFEDEEFGIVLKFIKDQYSDYFKNIRLLHNTAIAALGIIEKGELNISNFKEIISIWLTAIYSDILFVRSLDNSQWDDDYTFTLVDSLGVLKSEELDNLPQNINFETANESNISIGEVQRSLIATFENLLKNEAYEDNFITTISEFYEYEKSAIQCLNDLKLEEEYFSSTPTFAENHKELSNLISYALNNEFNYNCDEESVLKVGILYGIQGDRFKRYSDAKILCSKALDVVAKMQFSQIKLIFTNNNIEKIIIYSELHSTLCNELKSNLDLEIKTDEDYEKIIANYLVVCSALNDANLNYTISNYANRECISRLNDEIIPKSKGLELLGSVYTVIKDNTKLKQNLQSVLNSAVVDIVVEGDVKLRKTVGDFLNTHIHDFEKEIAETLEQALQIIVLTGKKDNLITFIDSLYSKSNYKSKFNQLKSAANEMQVDVDLHNIIELLNNNRVNALQGLRQTYDLYKLHRDHERLCDNLVILCGNVISNDIMESSVYSSQLCTVLDNICNNRSTTFRNSARPLAQTRRGILNQFDSDTRSQLEGLFDYNLSTKGKSIKKGLEYLKRLSE